MAVPEPDDALNVAVSDAPGTLAPLDPPLAVLQLVVLDQLPVPPETQNLAAILCLCYTTPLAGGHIPNKPHVQTIG